MKKSNKLLSLILSLVMLFSITAGVDLSAYALESSGSCGDNVTYSFDSTTGTLTISGTGAMYDYGYYGSTNSPFYNSVIIKNIIINNGVTRISRHAFYECTSLTSITIPDSVTSIGIGAFCGCKSLISITIPDSVTSIDDSVFYYCINLTSVTIPDSVTRICDFAFYDCSSLTDITIPNSVTYIGHYAFYYCSCLTDITIPDSVTSIGQGTFGDCTSLSNVTIGNSVSSIGNYAFDGCTSLSSVTIPDSVTSIGKAPFCCCDNLTKIVVDSGNENYVSIEGVLFNIYQDHLIQYPSGKTDTTYVIPNSVTSIGYNAFACCSSLTSITIPNSVTSIGDYAFEYCSSLTSVTIPNGVTRISRHAFYKCTSLTSITIPDSVTSIGYEAFCLCKSITNVTIPNSVTSIGDYAFNSCSSLTGVAILNEKCNIGTYSIKATIYGFAGSTAEEYAKTNNNTFLAIQCQDYDLSHLYDENIIKKATCTENGTKEYTCSRCAYSFTEDLSALGGEHNYTGSTFIEPTCTEKGTTRYTCSKCGNYYDLVNIDALNHSYTSQVITQPTCTENGTKEYTCSRCAYSFTEDLSALGGKHNYTGSTFIEPTCTEKGTTRYTCSKCGDYYDLVDIDALNHSYSSQVIIEPTCTEKGTTRYTCSNCGDYYDLVDIDALNHSYTSQIITQPTCTEKGTTRYTCSRCGDYYDLEDIDKLRHNYDSKILNEPTCEDEGILRYTCTSCGYYYDESIEALGHDTKIVESEEPSLVSDGYQVIECQRERCDYYNFKTIPQLVLDYNQKIQSNGTETYKIEMPEAGYLIFDFVGEGVEWYINIFDEDGMKVNTLSPEFKEFFKKSYLQASIGSTVPNKNQIVALLSGTYYVEIVFSNGINNDGYSGDYEFSVAYVPCNETIHETKNELYNDAPTAKDIALNKTYNGFLGSKYALSSNHSNTDERDAFRFEIPKGSGWAQLNVILSSKAFAPFESDCTIAIYNAEFELCEDFEPLTVSSNETKNEIAYLYEGVYYFAVINKGTSAVNLSQGPIEYSFNTVLKPSGTYICTEHKAKLVETKNPTCTIDGYHSYVCQICNTEFKETISATGHNPVTDKAINPTCNTTGLTEGSHCSTCGSIIVEQKIINKTAHNYNASSIKKATISSDGNISQCCFVCGAKATTVIPRISSLKLSGTSYTYDGKVKTPAVTVKDSKGKTLVKNTDYTVSYASGRKYVGQYAVKITFKGKYSGTKTVYFTINPKSTSISSVSAKSKGFTVKWKKQSTQTTGYQIQYSTSSKFSKSKTVTVSKNSTTSKTVSKLSGKKKYYVRVRTYKTVKINGKSTKIYSSWSKAKAVTTKK